MNMNTKNCILVVALVALTMLTGCFGGKLSSSSGRVGEVTGVSGKAFSEPTPY